MPHDDPERQKLQRAFSTLFQQYPGVVPDKLAYAAVEAAFDHLLNPTELDHASDGPFEDEVHKIAAKLVKMVGDEEASLCELIRRQDRPFGNRS